MLRLLIRRTTNEGFENTAHVSRIRPWRMAPALGKVHRSVIVHDAANRRRPLLIRETHRELRACRSADEDDTARIAAELRAILRHPIHRRTHIDDLLGPLPLRSVPVIDRRDNIAALREVA